MDTSGISDEEGLNNVSYYADWIADDPGDITRGGTLRARNYFWETLTYTVTSSDVGKTLKVLVSFQDDAGNRESIFSANTAVVTAANSPATGAPTISGTAQVGQTLTAGTSGISDADGLTNVTYSYQWLADDTAIDGATSSSYTIQATDNGKAIRVRVEFTDDGGNQESLTSVETDEVLAGGL